MTKEEIKELADKMKELQRENPLKFAELKGRIDATYEMNQEARGNAPRLRGAIL